MVRVLECVPNFSEGRDERIVGAIADAIKNVPGVLLAGHEMDGDHNRSVFTFAGKPNAVMEAAIQAVGVAVQRIDISRHAGVHPRVGAADVVPFIPLEGATMQDAIRAAEYVAEQIWKRWMVPTYLYAEAARRPPRRRLENVRRKGFDGAPPDFGDTNGHATAGASVVGARPFLIAFNVDLVTPDINVAKEIAKRIRASSGGFAHVKALGLYLESRSRAQVTMNLTDFRETPLGDVYQKIASSAQELGTSVADCEVIGFVPELAFQRYPEFFRRASNFNESRILEPRLRQLLR